MNRITRSPAGEGATTGGPDALGQGSWGIISDWGLRDERLREERNCPSLREDQGFWPMPRIFAALSVGNAVDGRADRLGR
jgi:hypothetical protein